MASPEVESDLESVRSTCVSWLQVTRLNEGTEYEFRVAASNSAGTGPFSGASDSAFAVDPLSELTLLVTAAAEP